MHCFARASLVPFAPSDDRPRLMLEGDWNGFPPSTAGSYLSLDELVDGRFSRLDAEAEELAERFAAYCDFAARNVLRLRYALVKWMRPITAWRHCFGARQLRQVDLYVSTSADDREYVALLQASALAFGFRLRVHEMSLPAIETPLSLAPNRPWRRLLGAAAAMSTRTPQHDARPRVLFCGNPRILGPICDEVLKRRAAAAWLFDRFAVRPWWRWAMRGVPVYSCDETRAAASPTLHAWRDFSSPANTEFAFEGVDLLPAYRAWRSLWGERLAANQSRTVRRTAEHIAAFRPTHVVVDEDATPLPRTVIEAGREVGAKSFVVQHGVCGVRFGFAPLFADRFFAADEESRRQMTAWNTSPERIEVVGSIDRARNVTTIVGLRQEQTEPQAIVERSDFRTILLIGTVPPRDHRPDFATFHFTTGTYRKMLQAVVRVVGEMSNVQLVYRPHPRTGKDSIFQELMQQSRPGLCRIATTAESVSRQIVQSCCVLSCASSAGLEAAAAGAPVVQLLPEGSGEMIPAESYGMLGTARTLDELRPLLDTALRRGWQTPTECVSVSVTAGRIADAVLQSSRAAGDSSPPSSRPVMESGRV